MEGVENPTGVADKGKGKAPAPDAMEESGEDESSEESGAEDQVRSNCILQAEAQITNLVAIGCWYDLPLPRATARRHVLIQLTEEPEDEEETMAEIDTDNIVGKRTRGKNIDFAKAAKELGDEDDEDDDDDDFNDPDDEMKD